MKKVKKIELLKRYEEKKIYFEKINEYGMKAIKGLRKIK